MAYKDLSFKVHERVPDEPAVHGPKQQGAAHRPTTDAVEEK